MKTKKSLRERFLLKIYKNAKTECWEWTASRSRDGYGNFGIGNHKTSSAHRFSYEMHCGIIPDGMLVLHRCDNPSCVNPKHLFLGTHTDNMADKVSKGRQARGRALPHTKLTEADVIAIRSSTGVKQVALAARYGVNENTISKVILGKTWLL